MDETRAATCLEALGQPRRLAIYRLLVRAGEDGLTVGAVQRALGLPASTLSHHLGWLARAGLIAQHRTGREIRCRADYVAMREMVGFLTAECCRGVEITGDRARPSVDPANAMPRAEERPP